MAIVKTPIDESYMVAVANFVESHKALLDACDDNRVDDIPALTEHLEEDTKTLLEEKERQGFEDGLSFIEDNTFEGFKIVNGRLIGDEVSAYQYGCECAAGFRRGAFANVFYELALFILYNVDRVRVRSILYGNETVQGRTRAA